MLTEAGMHGLNLQIQEVESLQTPLSFDQWVGLAASAVTLIGIAT